MSKCGVSGCRDHGCVLQGRGAVGLVMCLIHYDAAGTPPCRLRFPVQGGVRGDRYGISLEGGGVAWHVCATGAGCRGRQLPHTRPVALTSEFWVPSGTGGYERGCRRGWTGSAQEWSMWLGCRPLRFLLHTVPTISESPHHPEQYLFSSPLPATYLALSPPWPQHL